MRLLLDLQGLQSESRHRGIGRLTSALTLAIVDQAASRHDVHILLNDLLEDVSPTMDALFRRLPRSNIHRFTCRKEVAGQPRYSSWRAGSAALVRETVVARLQPDIVHLSSLFEGFVDEAVTSIGRLAAPHATAVTFYDLIPLASPEQYLADPVYKRYYLRQAQDLKRADRLLAISDFVGGEAEIRLQIPAEKISVIGAGVSDEFRPVHLPSRAETALRERLGVPGRFVLHVGAVDPRKNVGLLIEAFGLLPGRLSSGRQLVFVGPITGDERDGIFALGHRFGLATEALVVPGLIPIQDLVALYGLADAFVFPSTNEGFGLPPLEAMACGAPVLAADATAIPDVVGRQDCLFDPTDAGKLADLLARLLTQDAWRQELSDWGIARAAKFRWTSVGERALAALERTADEHAARCPARHPLRRRPRMAFVSPLPPDQTGIADYSAELLRELLIFYDIDCILPDSETNDDWIEANTRTRSVGWFEAHAHQYDRILYSIGNSTFHAHMFDLMVRFPGTVILHDAFLSDLAFHVSKGVATAPVLKEVYRSHGLTGLRLLREGGAEAAIETLTMSGSVYRHAQGVIIHSRHACRLATDALGHGIEDFTRIVPQLRALPTPPDRAAARRKLGLAAEAFVICAFGIVHPRKANRLLAEAFIRSALAKAASCTLLFVGKDLATFGQTILDEVVEPASAAGTVRFVGRVDDDLYGLYLQAADVAVQLRTESRGETSRAVLDAMAYGLPTVVSELGSAAELPDTAVIKLPVGAGAHVLAGILEQLWLDPGYRARMGASARDEIARHHHPAVVGARIRDLVDGFAAAGPRVAASDLMTALADLPGEGDPGLSDLEVLSRHVQALSPTPRLQQILCDVSAIARQDLRTGIERVVRAVLERLIEAPPAGYRIEPVIAGEDGYLYARRFSAERLDLSTGQDADEPVEIGAGDHFLGLDWVPDQLPLQARWLERFRRAGGTVTVVVYDLLPLEQPGFFPDWLHATDERWFATLVRSADRLACISASVADSVARLAPLPALEARQEPLPVGWFHLGHDLAASRPSRGLPEETDRLIASLAVRPTFLMVGTVEPRKGHGQVVAAFERLWAEGSEAGLCIVGKEGWMVDDIAAAIRASPELGGKLHWLRGASDELLERAYASAAALIAASFGEGFGLPLIEAAGHGVPVIARDIPVFREVGGDHAFYFRGEAPDDLADALRAWLRLRAEGGVPTSAGMARRSWADATDDLTAIMFGERCDRVLSPGGTDADRRRTVPS